MKKKALLETFMKRLLALLLVLMLAFSLLVACAAPNCDKTDTPSTEQGGETNPPDGGETNPPDGGETNPPDGGETNPPDGGETNPPDGGEVTPPDEPLFPDYKYTAFTATEQETLITFIGELVPFLPTDEYYLEAGSDILGSYMNYYTYGNTDEDFENYLTLFKDYTLTKTEDDNYGDTWYYYEKGEVAIELSYYFYEGEYIVDMYIISLAESDGPSGTLHTDFTAEEKQFIIERIGELIPFIPTYYYNIEESDSYYENSFNYFTFDNTQEEYDAFISALVGYTLVRTDKDAYGDTIYFYEKGDICIDISYYCYDESYVIDMYVYRETSGGGSGDSGNTGGGDSGNTGGGDSGNTGDTNADIITNDGKGLPTAEGGVHNVDFTGATNVKDVTDQGYYLDGCPTTGSPAVLVIPVEFLDVTAASKGYEIPKLTSAFASNDPSDGFYSVYEYYYISSYGKLSLDFTVLENWFKPKYDSSYYANSTDSEGYANGDQLVIDEALAYLSTVMDLSKFDTDGNNIIDAVVVVHTLDINSEADFYWAYRYWNYYTDDDGYYYEYDGVSANDYLWASFDFLHEGYDEEGYVNYDDDTLMNTYTFIHEFGHVLGADDYYDTAEVGSPMSGCDIMDSMFGDHNAFTKFNYGWLTASRLVVADGSVTLTLEDFSKNGDTIIIANNWDDTLGAYQEYFILAYYRNVGLNGGENGYFSRDGVVVYHVNASLYAEEYDGEVYYDIYYNNTDPSSEYGRAENLIEYVKSAADTYTYAEGDTMGAVTDDAGNPLAYNFVVDSLTEDAATITFTKA